MNSDGEKARSMGNGEQRINEMGARSYHDPAASSRDNGKRKIER